MTMPLNLSRCLALCLLPALLLSPGALAVARASEPQAETSPPQRLLALFAELSDALGRANEDCDAVAGALSGWTRGHAEELLRLTVSVEAHLEGLAPGEVAELERRLGSHFDIVIGHAVVCAGHEATLVALDEMDQVLTGASAVSEHGDDDTPAP